MLNIWITSVVSVVLYTTSHSSTPSPRHHTLPHLPTSSQFSSSCPLPTLSSLSSIFAPYLTTLLFIWVVYCSVFLSSVLSFFWSPEYQSFPYSSASLCMSPSFSGSVSSPLNSSHSLMFPHYQFGPLVSEVLYHPCQDDSSVLIAIRKFHHRNEELRDRAKEAIASEEEEDLEIEIMSRVSPGTDLLLRLDLQHWEDRYWDQRTLSHPLQRVSLHYEGVSSDGWWVCHTCLPY